MTAFVYYLGCLLILIAGEMNGQTPSKQPMIRFLALGDSYTIGESVAPEQRWPALLVQALARDGHRASGYDIIAITGWRTDQLRDAVQSGNLPKDYNLVSLLIGVNDQYQNRSVSAYEEEFRKVLDMAIAHAGGDKARVFVLSIPDYGYTPFGRPRKSEISAGIDAFNEVNKRVSQQKGVAYIDITDISRRGLSEPGLVATDGLHPSPKMYQMWVERMLPAIPLAGISKQ